MKMEYEIKKGFVQVPESVWSIIKLKMITKTHDEMLNVELSQEIVKYKKRCEQLFNLSIDKNMKVEKKQKIISAALIMIKTMHRQPVDYEEILGWLCEYVDDKENDDELFDAYYVVNYSSNYTR